MKKSLLASSLGITTLLLAVLSFSTRVSIEKLPSPVSAKAAAQIPTTRPSEIRLRSFGSSPSPSVRAVSTATSTRAPKLPLEFETNRGQASTEYAFVAHGPTYALGLSPAEIALSMHRPHPQRQAKVVPASLETGSAASQEVDRAQVHLHLLGASKSASIAGLQLKPGVSNYFIGNDPAKWQTHVPHYGQVNIASAYPGIDLVFYGNPQQLEYDFVVAPGGDVGAIRLEVAGTDSTALNSEGDLVIETAAGDVQLKHPNAYQETDGARKTVHSAFRLTAKNTVGLVTDAYDRTKPLIIDPVLLYAVSLGGTNGNQATGMDVDSAGNAYVTGSTCSMDFPSTGGSFQNIHTNVQTGTCQDTFVLKLDPTASTLLYSDFIGGSVAQSGSHIAVDSSGNTYVTGLTGSTDFPLINNIGPVAPVPCGFVKSGFNCPTGFVFKLSADGSKLLFSTLLGGGQSAAGFQVKLNPVTGDVVVLGETNSSDFKPVPNTLQTTFAGGTCDGGNPCFNAFLVGLDPTTGAYKYGTFLGSTEYTFAVGLAFDAGGDIYLTGSAQPPIAASFGAATHTYAPAGTAATGSDIFVTRLHLSGATLSTSYLTLIQGEQDDGGGSVAVDASGNAYVFGSTASLHLPVTSGVFQSTNTNTGGDDCHYKAPIAPLLPDICGTGFVAKVDSGGALSFLTYFGGNNQTQGEAIGVDSTGKIWLTGVTSATDFPFSADAYSSAGIVKPDAFNSYVPYLAQMSNDGTSLPFASPIASSIGQSPDLRIDSNDNVYVTGRGTGGENTALAYVPTTPNVYPANQNAYENGFPIFVQKWNGGPQPVLQLSSTALTFPPTAYGSTSVSQTVTAQNTGGGALELSIQLSISAFDGTAPPSFVESDDCGPVLAANASCTITATFQPGPPATGCADSNGCTGSSRSGIVTIQTNAATGTQTIGLLGTTGIGAALTASPKPVVFLPQTAGTTSSSAQVELDDTGDVPLIFSGISIGGTNAADFQISSTGSCLNGPLLGGGCVVSLVFSPSATATGTRTAALLLTDNAGDSPQPIPISGLVSGAGTGLLISTNNLYTGSAVIGAAAITAQGNVTLTNPSSDTDIQVTALAVTGTNSADFTIDPVTYPKTLPLTIAKGTSLNLDVNFVPIAGPDGLRSATLTVGTNPAVSGLGAVALSGDALTNNDPNLTYFSDPTPQDFGSLQIGQSSLVGSNLLSITALQSGSYACSNGNTTCGGPLTITSLATGLSDYTIVVPQQGGYCTAPPLTIPAGDSCEFQLVFTPSAAGSRNSTLTINSNDPLGPTTIPLVGTGLALPLSSLSVNALNFGYSAIGTASAPLMLTLTNFGQSNLTVSDATASTNYAVASNTCTAALVPGATCTIGVTFMPPAAGSYPGTLTITDNNYFGAKQVVALSGIGADGALLRVSPATISFPSQNVGTTSDSRTITLVSTGTVAVSFPANSLRLFNSDFLMSTTCGTSLQPGDSCTVTVRFKPTTLYGDDGTLLIADNAMGGPQAVYLAGFGAQAGGTPKVTVTSSANPIAVGQQVTFTATVAGTSAGAPVATGQVAFYNYVNPLGTVNLNASGQASVTTSALAMGNQVVSAIYAGDLNYSSNSSNVVTEIVNPATNTPTATTLISSANPSTNGQLVIFTATVAGTTSTTFTPSGPVTFMDGSTVLGTVNLNGAGQSLFSYTSPSNGSHSITAVYAGNGTFAGSTSTTLTQVVNVSTKTSTTTSLTSSLNPATTGQSISFTATVAGTSGSTSVPTGTVMFLDGSVMLGIQSLNSSAQTAFSIATLVAGSHSITAVYSADSNFAASTSPALVEVVSATTKSSTRTTVASSLNPATTGQSLTFTATVAGSGSGVPTGSVSFLDGTTMLGMGTLNGSAQATFSTAALIAGSHSITVVYGGDNNYAGSTSAAVIEVVSAPAKISTMTTLSSSANPATTGQSIVFTAAVSGATSVPTGTVSFLDGTTVLGMGTLNGSAQITLTISTLSVGSHPITAVYSADSNHTASTSAVLTEVIDAPAKIATTTLLAASPNPATVGQSVTFTASVAGTVANTPAPTGTVTFLDGTTSLGTGTLSSPGVASFTANTLAQGSHSITAQYAGDANYLASATTSDLTETIDAAASFAVSFSPSSLTVTAGQSGASTVTVKPAGGFNQSVAFACSGLPKYATCTFNPATVTPNGTAAATSTLTIATDVATAANDGSGPLNRPANGGVWSAGVLLGLGFLATLRGRRLGGKNRWAVLFVFGLSAGMVAIQLVGCGGSTKSAAPQTPAGTSSIVVTATAGSVSQSSTLTFIVQ